MRRRVDSRVDFSPTTYSWVHINSPVGVPEIPALRISEVPELWRRHARQPWRVLFPSLDWPNPK